MGLRAKQCIWTVALLIQLEPLTILRLLNCSKIDDAVNSGDQPYELKTEQKAVRRPKPVKKALSKKERSKRK